MKIYIRNVRTHSFAPSSRTSYADTDTDTATVALPFGCSTTPQLNSTVVQWVIYVCGRICLD